MSFAAGLLAITVLCCSQSWGETARVASSNEIPQQVSDGAANESTNEVSIETEGIKAAASSLSHLACLSDIHAVLREMSALMAEQRVELRHTQSELQAVTKRLEESESLFKAALDATNFRTNATESNVQALQRQNEVKRVSFSTSLLASGNGHTGPYNTKTILVFKHVITNIGNAYSSNTGLFRAPVKGVYQFTYFLYGEGGNHGIGAYLMKNGERVVRAYAHQQSYGVSTSNGASLLLEAGDVVYVELAVYERVFDDADTPNHVTTFRGHILFTV